MFYPALKLTRACQNADGENGRKMFGEWHCQHFRSKNVQFLERSVIFSVQCTIVQSMVLLSHVICPSVCLSIC